jgi:hypothetical protein
VGGPATRRSSHKEQRGRRLTPVYKRNQDFVGDGELVDLTQFDVNEEAVIDRHLRQRFGPNHHLFD